MGDSSGLGGKVNESGALEITGTIMVVSVFVLFLVVVIIFLLHLYAKWFRLNRNLENHPNSTTASRRRGRRRFAFAPGYQELNAVTNLHRGLEHSVLKTIPLVVFNTKDFKDGLECAVCLSEVSEGDKARFLPKCNHGFHVECIDMWFHSHSTCPLCRNPISNQCSVSSGGPESPLESILQEPIHDNPAVIGYSIEVPNFPTNVLFWGNETRVSNTLDLEEGNRGLGSSQPPTASASPRTASSSSLSTSTSNRPDGALVIDIQGQINEDEESKSPLPTRPRSLKRLLSRDRRSIPRSPRDFDVENQLGDDRGQS